MQRPSPYPRDFLWGASTASHQVEGGTVNQWSHWEKEQAVLLAQTAKDRISWVPVWANIRDQAADPENYISGSGVEHFTRYQEDFAILHQLGMNAFRFGIEWARLQPAEGEWDTAAVEHYKRYILELKARGIEPILTIWHWTMPVWFTDRGGFCRRSNLNYFDTYVARLGQEFGPLVKYVIILNEPNVYAGHSYLIGEWPPEKKSAAQFLRVYWNLTHAHRRAYRLLKQAHPGLQVGIAAQLGNMQPKRPGNLIDMLAAKVTAYGNNWWFLNRIRKQLDFVGINYYFTDYWHGFRRHNPAAPLSDMGWYMEPSGLLPLMLEVSRRYNLPIMITENGLADAEDKRRQWWLSQTMMALEAALAAGVQLIGYLHWSLLDNFEWKYGWWPKFGLVKVDREQGMRRTVRGSTDWLKKYIKTSSQSRVYNKQ